MDAFSYHDGQLYAEDMPLSTIAAQVGTPCYVYSRSMIENQWRAFDNAFAGRDHLVCYAVKANPNLAILNLLAHLGSGFDIVSGGELERVLRAGGDPSRVVFSGVGKSDEEMRRALDVGIRCFNVESEGELLRLHELSEEVGCAAPVALRVNPDVDPNTHPHIATGLKENKFGIPIEAAPQLYAQARQLPHIDPIGVACHIGSQLVDMGPFVDALERVLSLVDELDRSGLALQSLDLGGGLGIRYSTERPPPAREYVATLSATLDALGSQHRHLRVMIEPGRALVGEAGVLLTRIQYLKRAAAKNFAIVDAAMNDLLRPALYDAWHEVKPVFEDTGHPVVVYDVVGPVCETGDFLARDRKLGIAPGELLAISCAGAYGACMSSRYNTRPLTAEVMVDGDHLHVIRRRETIDEMLGTESILPQ